jgi:hypothetical protein
MALSTRWSPWAIAIFLLVTANWAKSGYEYPKDHGKDIFIVVYKI